MDLRPQRTTGKRRLSHLSGRPRFGVRQLSSTTLSLNCQLLSILFLRWRSATHPRPHSCDIDQEPYYLSSHFPADDEAVTGKEKTAGPMGGRSRVRRPFIRKHEKASIGNLEVWRNAIIHPTTLIIRRSNHLLSRQADLIHSQRAGKFLSQIAATRETLKSLFPRIQKCLRTTSLT